MKKLFLMTVASVMAVVGAGAQDFDRGDWFVGAQSTGLGLNHSFGKNILSNTTFNLNGYGGWFWADGFAVDALLGLDVAKAKGLSGTTNFVFGAGVRYYPWNNLYARLGYRGTTVTGGALTSTVGIDIGYDFFLTDDVFFEPAAYYVKNLSGLRPNGLGLSMGLGMRF
jgi:opacity protein-like surface antigen